KQWLMVILPPANPYGPVNQIIGGSFCVFGSRPYQVALLRNGRIYCGGSLIAPKWVLTAAHCGRRIRRIRAEALCSSSSHGAEATSPVASCRAKAQVAPPHS
uniref:Peptidase S1 domain-containing protein n=1 Tax=Terrapene triunguis TaxID=2587831 RepID=A0A674ISL0_9SAUR